MTSAEHAIKLAQAIAAYRGGDDDTAERLYCEVLATDPLNVHALAVLGLVYQRRGAHDLARGLLEAASRLEPSSHAAHNLGVVLAEMGRLTEAIAGFRQAVWADPGYLEAGLNLIFALDLHQEASPTLLLEERRAFDARLCADLTAAAPPHRNDRDPDRRLRVGYVSGDFKRHSAAQVVEPFILAHDPAQVELLLYSAATDHDETSARFRERADVWCEIADLTDDELAAVIREDAVDILVDLSGYSAGSRLLAFARRPAPVQVTGWGYATGTGLACVDALMADAVTVPPEHEDRYHERIVRLPSLLAYAPWDAPELAAVPPAVTNGYRTYGYLGRPYKLGERTFAAWASILRADPTARLLLKSGQFRAASMRDYVARSLLALGVDPRRLECRGSTSRAEHLAAHNEVDVCLDVLGHNGGATTLDACLMGVPSVVLLGERTETRLGASIMTTLGCEDRIARTPEQYVELAQETPVVSGRLLRQRLLGSVICDGPAYARAVEAAYRDLWRVWCDG